VPDEPGKNERLQGRILDLDGNRVTAPWMRGWKGRYWGCANSPQYRESYVAYAKRAVDAGTDGLQMDDPPMNVAAVRWGGCFCPHCMAGFRQYLKSQAATADLAKWEIDSLDRFDYRDYLEAREAPVGDAFARYPTEPPMSLIIVPGKSHQVCPEFFECQELVDFVVTQTRSE
jgi:hypothetical protein